MLRAFHTTCLAARPDIPWAQVKRFTLGTRERRAGHRPHGTRSTGAGTGEVEVEIVDYKTGKPKTDAHARKDLQLSVYALCGVLEEIGAGTRSILRTTACRLTNAWSPRATKSNSIRFAASFRKSPPTYEAREFPFQTASSYMCKTCEFRFFFCPFAGIEPRPVTRAGRRSSPAYSAVTVPFKLEG